MTENSCWLTQVPLSPQGSNKGGETSPALNVHVSLLLEDASTMGRRLMGDLCLLQFTAQHPVAKPPPYSV